jgi:hypothetical protein
MVLNSSVHFQGLLSGSYPGFWYMTIRLIYQVAMTWIIRVETSVEQSIQKNKQIG